MEIRKDKFNEDWLMKQITVRGKLEKLKTSPPKDGIAKFVWRNIRFHSGIDPTFPVSCYYNLADQLNLDNQGLKFSCTFFSRFEKVIIDELDKLVISCAKKLNLVKLMELPHGKEKYSNVNFIIGCNYNFCYLGTY